MKNPPILHQINPNWLGSVDIWLYFHFLVDFFFYQGKKQVRSRAMQLFFNTERRKKRQEGEIIIKCQQSLRCCVPLILILLLVVSPVSAAKGNIYIELFKLQPVAKKLDSNKIRSYKAQLNIKYQLTDYLHQALLNGVILKSKLEFTYHQPDNWFWNKKTSLGSLKFQLKYHALSRHYLLSRNDTSESWNFGNLPAALRKMGEIRNYKLPRLEKRDADNANYITAIVYLEPEKIKLPLRIQALMSNEYDLSSQEARWQLP